MNDPQAVQLLDLARKSDACRIRLAPLSKELVRVAKLLLSDKKEAYQKLLEYVQKGTAILTAQDIHRDVPTIHNFEGPGRKYHNTVDHMGYGMFKGHTEHGDFVFDAGGAMNHDEGISWTTLDASREVLRDLGYDFRRVERALKQLLEQEQE